MTQKRMTGVMSALGSVLAVGEGTEVVVITDNESLGAGRRFFDSARALGADARLYVLPAERPLKEIPRELLGLISGYGKDNQNLVFINAFSGIAGETPIRVALVAQEKSTGARVGHAPGIEERMMTGGAMDIDYRALAAAARKLIARFEGARSVDIKSPSGTDITLDIEGRGFVSDVEIPNATMGNLPAGEVWCAPVEDGASGVIVCDRSIGDLGAVVKPLKLTVKAGRLTGISGGTPALIRELKPLLDVDESARVMGELGIGLNPGAKVTGNLLEDEKAGETAHIAFGYNRDMPGGRNSSKTHRDFLFLRPTIEITFQDGQKVQVIKDGKLII